MEAPVQHCADAGGDLGVRTGARQRPFDKSRNSAGSRRMAGLRVTDWGNQGRRKRRHAGRMPYKVWLTERNTPSLLRQGYEGQAPRRGYYNGPPVLL